MSRAAGRPRSRACATGSSAGCCATGRRAPCAGCRASSRAPATPSSDRARPVTPEYRGVYPGAHGDDRRGPPRPSRPLHLAPARRGALRGAARHPETRHLVRRAGRRRGPPPAARRPGDVRARGQPHEPPRRAAHPGGPAAAPRALPRRGRRRRLLLPRVVAARAHGPVLQRLPGRPRRRHPARRLGALAARTGGAAARLPGGNPIAERRAGALQTGCRRARDRGGGAVRAGGRHRGGDRASAGQPLAQTRTPPRGRRLRRPPAGRAGGVGDGGHRPHPGRHRTDARRLRTPYPERVTWSPGVGCVARRRETVTDVEHMKWWGWGVEGVGFRHEDKPGFAPFVLDAVGLDLATARPVGQPDFAELTLADPIVPDAFREALVDIVGPDFVTSDPMERVVHSYGKSLRDLVRIRSNRVERAVDLVVYPADEDDVQRIVDAAVAADVVIIPFGGGSNIAGSLEPLPGERRPVLSLDMGRMNSVIEIDAASGLARIQAGALGPHLEAQLAAQGWTIGHFPDSFTHSTIGGWAATRSSGMQSDKYDDIAQIVRGLRVVRPSGEGRDGVLVIPAIPSASTGPSVREMIIGSEGRLGVITEVTAQVHRVPEVREIQAYFFP